MQESGILMSDGERFPMTARPVKYYFKYLFAIFHDHISLKQIFSLFKLKFSDRIYWSHFFHPTFPSNTKNHTAKQNEL